MEAYTGMILAFAGNYAPVGWLLCDGSNLSISEYQQLFYVIQTRYGGDGVSNFRLPDLRDRVVVGDGQGSGLSRRTVGEMGGANEVVLNLENLPVHSHAIKASTAQGELTTPVTNCTLSAINNTTINLYDSYTDTANPPNLRALNNSSIQQSGGNTPHTNIQPYQKINYIICYDGYFPTFE